MTTRIAPTLRAKVNVERITYPHGDWAMAEKELRALLAVARAAESDLVELYGPEGWRAGLRATSVTDTTAALCRALSRLSRLSQPTKPPRKRGRGRG